MPGHRNYSSKRAKEQFAANLMSIGEKVILAGLLPYIGYILNPASINVLYAVLASSLFVALGLVLRDQALKTYDDIELNRITIENANAPYKTGSK